MAPARPGSRRRTRGPLGRIWSVARWFMLASLVLTVALILRRAPAPAVGNDPRAAAQAAAQFSEAATQARAGQPAEVRLDSTQLTSFLDTNLALGGGAGPSKAGASAEAQTSVRDVKITMAGDRVLAYVLFGFHGQELSLILEGRLSDAGGSLRFAPLGGAIGSLPLPRAALEVAVQRMMDSPENRDKFLLPEDIRDVRVENGELVIAYR